MINSVNANIVGPSPALIQSESNLSTKKIMPAKVKRHHPNYSHIVESAPVTPRKSSAKLEKEE